MGRKRLSALCDHAGPQGDETMFDLTSMEFARRFAGLDLDPADPERENARLDARDDDRKADAR